MGRVVTSRRILLATFLDAAPLMYPSSEEQGEKIEERLPAGERPNVIVVFADPSRTAPESAAARPTVPRVRFWLILRASVGIGTAINVVAVLVSGGIGTMVGSKLPEGVRHTAMQATGIVTLFVGVSNFLVFDRTCTQNVLRLTLVTVQ